MAALTSAGRRFGTIFESLARTFEEVGRQLSFYLSAIGAILTLQVIRRRYTSIVWALMSDITKWPGSSDLSASPSERGNQRVSRATGSSSASRTRSRR